jgi:catechol 2,3-dioxygenase-like lactoylglutathione lyase family enzyme
LAAVGASTGDGSRNGRANCTDPRDSIMKRLSLLAVYVKDQDAAIEFYTKKLGFVVVEDVPFGPQRWVTLRLPDDEVVSIALNLAMTNEDRALVGKQGGTQPYFGIVTDDCMREYRQMKGAGVKFHGEPQVQPYGTGVTLEDLYGNKIYLNEEPR